MRNESSLEKASAAPAPAQLATRETAADVLAAQAKAQIEARYIVAMRQPRDLDSVREKLLKECRRPLFAKAARYNKPVGGGIKGPSIRFAEAAVRCMTNISPEVITVYDDSEKRIVRVSVTDLEANVSYSQDVTVQKTVERNSTKQGDVVLKTRQSSSGKMVYILEGTDDEILNKGNALVSKALRTLALRIVPGDIVDECMQLVIDTVANADAKDPNAAKREVFDAFSSIGVTVEQLKEYLGHEGGTLQAKEIDDLRSLYTAIRDGEATWRDAMEARGMAKPAGETIADRARAGLEGARRHVAETSPAPEAVAVKPTEPENMIIGGGTGKPRRRF